MEVRELWGDVIVLYPGKSGGPNITKTFKTQSDLATYVVSNTPTHDLILELKHRYESLTLQELNRLEEEVQAEWDRRARARLHSNSTEKS